MNQQNAKDQTWLDITPAFPTKEPTLASGENETCYCNKCNCGDTCVTEDIPGPIFAVALAADAAFHLATSAGNKAIGW